jgi:formate hydrogenlyase transcriptional activator
MATECAQLARELQNERDRLRLLLYLNNRVTSNLNIDQLFQTVSSELRRVFKCDFVGLALPEVSEKQMRQHMVDFPGGKGLFKVGALYPIDASWSGRAFRSSKPVLLNSLSEGRTIWSSDPAFYRRVIEEGPFQSGCFLPLLSGDQPSGVLQLASRAEGSFSQADLELLAQVANQIAIALKNALEYERVTETNGRLYDENLALREQIDQTFMFEEIVGSSSALEALLASIVQVAPTDSTVLICGETGTGKELIARAIHKRSRRSEQAFISANCASIPTSLIASELFGHEKGAFTGALQRRQGRFELAHSGTIFLDEIGELPIDTQTTLLRVLQERQFERVGSTRTIAVDVRVIAATNRDLPAAIAAGTFRADLFYRLNVFPIQVPALRHRKEDIPMLVQYFVKRFSEKMGKPIRKVDEKTLDLLQRYQWPGNVRELQNIIERAIIVSSGETVLVDPSWLTVQEPLRPGYSRLTETLQSQEREMIEAALAASKGRVAGINGAAAKLGIPRSTLDRKIQQLKINKYNFRSPI